MKKLFLITNVLLIATNLVFAADSYDTSIKGDSITIDTIKDINGDFEPSIKFEKWKAEEYLKFTFKGEAKFKTDEKTLENKVKVSNSDMEINYFTVGDDMKVVITFYKKPKLNVYTFMIEGWENYNFYYQPALTQADIDDGCTRPDRVVGSYAVYHKTKRHNKYGNGKFQHIYRPLATDSINDKTWIDLHIENGVYTATIPVKFWEKAQYPITINDTFGETGEGGSWDNQTASQITMGKAVLGVTGDVSKITCWCKGQYDPATFACSTYLWSGTWPTTFKGGTNTAEVTKTGLGVDFSYASSIELTAATYGLGVWSDGSVDNTQIAYDSGSSGDGLDNTGNTFNSWPSPWGGTNRDRARVYSIYATYTTGGVVAPSGATPVFIFGGD